MQFKRDFYAHIFANVNIVFLWSFMRANVCEIFFIIKFMYISKKFFQYLLPISLSERVRISRWTYRLILHSIVFWRLDLVQLCQIAKSNVYIVPCPFPGSIKLIFDMNVFSFHWRKKRIAVPIDLRRKIYDIEWLEW